VTRRQSASSLRPTRATSALVCSAAVLRCASGSVAGARPEISHHGSFDERNLSATGFVHTPALAQRHHRDRATHSTPERATKRLLETAPARSAMSSFCAARSVLIAKPGTHCDAAALEHRTPLEFGRHRVPPSGVESARSGGAAVDLAVLIDEADRPVDRVVQRLLSAQAVRVGQHSCDEVSLRFAANTYRLREP
jgi:hypothetical protein